MGRGRGGFDGQCQCECLMCVPGANSKRAQDAERGVEVRSRVGP
jgi:hypothetical protein